MLYVSKIFICLLVFFAADACFWSGAHAAPCASFYFADSDFESVERDHLPSLLYVWSGSDSNAHGVAFLIDPTLNYYITARHVVGMAINAPGQSISAYDMRHNLINLELVGHSDAWDVALLKPREPARRTDGAPFEISLNSPASENVTFSGMAFSDPKHLQPTQPKEDRLVLGGNASEVLLRVNTDFGDSGAPVYNRKGLVVGIVINKQRLSQAVILPLRNVSELLGSYSMSQPRDSTAWRLHEDIVRKHPDQEALIQELTPAHIAGRPSNFELLGALQTVVRRNEFGQVDDNIIDCPLVEAAHDRGLQDAAFDFVRSYAVFRASNEDQPSTNPVHNDAWKHTEKRGDILLQHAEDWQAKDLGFSRRLGREAQINFAEALEDRLKANPDAIFELARFSGVNDDLTHRATRVLNELGVQSDWLLTRTPPTYISSTVATDDILARILIKFYKASYSAGDEGKTSPKLRMSAAWASILAQNSDEKVSALKLLSDELLKSDKPEQAIRSLAEVYQLNPTDTEAFREYVDIKTQNVNAAVATTELKEIIAKESPLTERELKPLALGIDGKDFSGTFLVGLAGPMTGPNAAFGAQLQQGAQQAVDDLNAKGGILGNRVVIDVGDDMSNPKQGVAIANKFVADGVRYVVGDFNSGVSIPSSAVYNQNGIVQITPASTSPKFTEQGFWNTFRTCGRDDQQGVVAADFIASAFKGKKVAILHDKTTYGEGLAAATLAGLAKDGVKPVLYEGVNAGEKDYSSVVSNLKTSGIDVVYWGGLHSEGGLIRRQMTEQGIKSPMVSGDGLTDSEFASIAGPGAEGTLMTFGPDPRKNPNAAAVVKEFVDKNFDPQAYTLYSYAAVQVMAQAVEAAKSVDPHIMADKMHEGMTFHTVIGNINYDKKGDPQQAGYVMYQWKKQESGQITYVQGQ